MPRAIRVLNSAAARCVLPFPKSGDARIRKPEGRAENSRAFWMVASSLGSSTLQLSSVAWIRFRGDA
jgi:hypothetical protein